MQFKKEVGALLDNNKNIIFYVEGGPSQVDILQERALDIHAKSPGSIYGFTHVHPGSMTDLSGVDVSTLHAWSVAFYPFPFRFLTIAQERPTDNIFRETTYLGHLQSKQEAKGENRRFNIDTVEECVYQFNNKRDQFWHGQFLLAKAYSW